MQATDLWFLAAIALAALFVGLYVRLGDSTALQFARAHFRRIKGDARAKPLVDIGENEFIQHYLATRRWRDPLYFATFVLVSVGATVLALTLSGFLAKIAYPGPLVWQFLIFFAVIASWIMSMIGVLWLYQTRKTSALLFWLNRRRNQDVVD